MGSGRFPCTDENASQICNRRDLALTAGRSRRWARGCGDPDRGSPRFVAGERRCPTRAALLPEACNTVRQSDIPAHSVARPVPSPQGPIERILLSDHKKSCSRSQADWRRSLKRNSDPGLQVNRPDPGRVSLPARSPTAGAATPWFKACSRAAARSAGAPGPFAARRLRTPRRTSRASSVPRRGPGSAIPSRRRSAHPSRRAGSG